MDFKPATSEASIEGESDVSSDMEGVNDRLCGFGSPSAVNTPVAHEVSVKLRFLRHGEPTCEQVHECVLFADETMVEVATKFAHAMCVSSVGLETKAARVYDSASKDFVAAQLSQTVDGTEKIEITFEVHGSDDECGHFFALITKTSANCHDEREASSAMNRTWSQESTDNELEGPTNQTSRIAGAVHTSHLQESIPRGLQLAVADVSKTAEEPGKISPDSLVNQYHEVLVEMRFLRGGELKHTHVHKCWVSAGRTLGAVVEKFKDSGGHLAELVPNALRVHCTESNSFVEARASDLADDVDLLEITFEVRQYDTDCEQFFAVLKKSLEKSHSPQQSLFTNNRAKSPPPAENSDSGTTYTSSRSTLPISKPLARPCEAHPPGLEDAVQPASDPKEECPQDRVTIQPKNDENNANTVVPMDPCQLQAPVEEIAEASAIVPHCRNEEKALDVCATADADGVSWWSVVDVPMTLRFLRNGELKKTLVLTYLSAARETINDVVNHYAGAYQGQAVDLEVKLVWVRRQMLPPDTRLGTMHIASKRLVEADMSELASGVLALVIEFEVHGSEPDSYRFFAQLQNQSSANHVQKSGTCAEAAIATAHHIENTPQSRESANQQSTVQVRRPIRQRKRVYILLLGSTGCGKSTFINMIACCTKFKTIFDACSAPGPYYAVPAEITIWNSSQDGEDDYQTVRVGPEDPLERFGSGSNTQDVRFYRFFTDEYEVILVDTPGIGDSEGVHRDQINMQKVVNAVAALPYLNLIVKLFKATENRITDHYRYCVTELLMRLHNSAMENIAFCFTHSRSYFFRPGEAIRPLNEYLKNMKQNHGKDLQRSKANSFSLDNEAVRFVYAYHNNVHFEQRDINDFAMSWDRTVSEIHRMLDYAASLKPHKVQQTVAVNQAREAVLIFARPLAEINDLIECNKLMVAERQKELEAMKPVIAELKGKIEFTHVVYDRKYLDYPMTVCIRCVTVQEVPNTPQKQVVYTQTCHDHCLLSGIALECFPQPELKNCRAMGDSGTTCTECGCSWELHMHINFKQFKVPKKFPNKQYEESLRKEENGMTLKLQLIADCEQKMSEYLKEQGIIKYVSLRFAAYLKLNAILPYDDVFEEYVKICIANEEMCVRADKNHDITKLDNLNRSLAEYRQQRDTLVAAIEAGDNSWEAVDITDIAAAREQLFELKHNGEQLKELYEAALTGYEFYKGKKAEMREPKIWKVDGKKKSSTATTMLRYIKSSVNSVKTSIGL